MYFAAALYAVCTPIIIDNPAHERSHWDDFALQLDVVKNALAAAAAALFSIS